MTGTDIVRANSPAAGRSWIELAEPAAQLAERVANTDFVPKALRGKPAAIAAAILYGDEVGLGPMQSLAKVHVIEGRPALSAEAQRALILKAGHRFYLVEATTTRATWAAARRENPDNVVDLTWTMDDAKRAKLDGKDVWRRYPRAMLMARASAELARAQFADVLGGLGAIEELDDGFIDGAGQVADAGADDETPPAPPKTKRKRASRAPQTPPPAAPPTPPPAAEEPPLPGEEEPPAGDATGEPDDGARLPFPNWYAMKLGELGFTDDARHAVTLHITDRRTETSANMSPGERTFARELIDGGRAAIFEALGWAEDAPEAPEGDQAPEDGNVVDLDERRQEAAEEPDAEDAEVVIETVEALREAIKAAGVRNSDVIRKAQQTDKSVKSLDVLVDGDHGEVLDTITDWLREQGQ